MLSAPPPTPKQTLAFYSLTSSSTLERPTARNLFLSCACILDIKLRSMSASEASARKDKTKDQKKEASSASSSPPW